MAPRHGVLHLATHGFFSELECSAALSELSTHSDPEAGVGTPWISGLALAGANDLPSVDENAEDGILTAVEISDLDLSQTNWAVLSACGTGLGRVRAGEGVFGLRRAFQLAGADTVIMSLWAVEDRATAEWMRRLYEARFIDGSRTLEAVRRATLDTLISRQRRGLPTHPFFWGAFVASGDWR
jgi:CHAT domain-containing protein